MNSLQQLDGIESVESAESPLASHFNEAIAKPLDQLGNDDLRFLIAQQTSLDRVVPIAIGRLIDQPLVSAEFYPGDLLVAVLSISQQFWDENPLLHDDAKTIASGLPTTLKEITERVEAFLNS